MPFRSRGTRGVFFWRRLGFISLVFILSTALTNHYARQNKDLGETHHVGARRNEPRLYDDIVPPGGDRGRIRKLLFEVTSPEMDYLSENDSVYEEELNCTPSTVDEFPKDIFTNQQRSKGAIILHTIFAVYMFLALAIVCDDYFVSSLEKICERLGFSEDVAGATFMAAGSSAPELFTSIIGVFIAKGDVGVGTIVGSAVFNILVIIGICGLFAGQVISLTWWPLFRDTLVYSISVITLVAVIYDGKVVWWESLIMLLMYGGYIFLMWLNPKIYLRMEKVTEKRRKRKQEAACNNSKAAIQLEQVTPLNAEEATSNGEKKEAPMVDEYICNSPKRLTFSDAGLRLMLTKQFPARTRLRTACWLIITEQKQMMAAEASQYPNTYSHPLPEGEKNGAVPRSDSICQDESVEVTVDKERAEDDVLSEHKFRLGDPDPLFAIPDTCGGIVKWIVSLPISILLFFTIPDCRRRRFERWYMATFFMSIIWIMIFSYLMVWMVAIIGYTLHIPDTIMGITFLAAGTSVPDAIASLLVAREGLGDMAVSNSIGSNVFDILLGLALPWFMKTTIVNYGSVIIINSRGLLYSVILLFASVAATILAIHFNKWKLNKQLGILLCLFYLVFLSFSIMVELNVFGYVNPPVCKH